MTTAVAMKRLPWDTFAPKDGPAREAIERFREVEWTNTRRQLKTDFKTDVSEAEEPHWVAPGRARLWRHEQSTVYGRVEDYGWQPSAHGLPCNSAAQILGFLRLGYQFRPPAEVSTEAVEAVEQDTPAGPAGGQTIEQRLFTCARHGEDKYELKTWKAYVQHCEHHQETLAEEPPEGVREAMRGFKWYCLQHGVGFHSPRGVKHHITHHTRPGRKHAPMKALEVRT